MKPGVRGLGVLCVTAGCAVPNAAFDDGSSTGGAETSAVASMDPSQDAGRPSSPSDPTEQSATSGDETTASGPSTADPTEGSTSSGGIQGDADSSGTDGVGDWWDADYDQRVSLAFSERAELMEGFVAYVDLQLGEGLFSDTEYNQFAFVDPLTQQRLASQVVHATPSGSRLRAWVRIPQWLPQDKTPVDLYWGSDAPMVQPDNPWGPEYLGVWHMDGITDAAEARNSAGGPLLETVGELGATDLAGMTYRALHFDGSMHRMSASLENDPLGSHFTVYAWARLDAYAVDGAPLFARGGSVGTNPTDTEWFLRFYGDSTQSRLHTDGGSQEHLDPPAELGEWHHYALRVTATEWTVFVDGGERQTINHGGALSHNLPLLSVGGYGSSTEPNWSSRLFSGDIDELVVRQGGDLSDAWIATVVENQQTPEQTYEVVGIEELR